MRLTKKKPPAVKRVTVSFVVGKIFIPIPFSWTGAETIQRIESGTQTAANFSQDFEISLRRKIKIREIMPKANDQRPKGCPMLSE